MNPTSESETPSPTIDDLLESMREQRGILVAGVGLLIGILGNFLFYDQLAGINLGLYVLMLVVVGVAIMVALEIPFAAKHAIFGVPAVVFAMLIGVHRAPFVVWINLMLATGSFFIFIRFSRLSRFLGGSPLEFLIIQIETFLVGWIEGALAILGYSFGFMKHLRLQTRNLSNVAAIVRGLLIALPILIVFGLLLGSADIVLGDFLEDMFGWFQLDESTVNQLFIIFLLTWINLNFLRLLVFGPPYPHYSPTTAPPPAKPIISLGMIESGIVLGSINLLFLVFVILQARYLFGGEANITAQGYTYSEYARRGFYEMLLVTVLTMGLILVMSHITRRQAAQEKLFSLLTGVLILLTGVILAAAWQRLALYEDAYGYTRLRVASAVFMAWLAVLLIILLADVLLKRNLKVFFIGGLLCVFGYAATINALNMDRFIASHNVERFAETGKIDIPYLLRLSDDAIPAIVPLIREQELDEQDRLTLLSGLADRLYVLDRDHAKRKGVDYHWSKAQAWQALNEYRDELAPYHR